MLFVHCILIASILHFITAFPFPFDFPTDIQGFRNFRLPKSITNPNLGLSIADTVSVSVDKTNGNVNLAGGVSHGFGLDAGIFTKTIGDSVTFSNGNGKAMGSGRGFGKGNIGASGEANVSSWVPSVVDGFSFSTSNALTNAIGEHGKSSGRSSSQVG